jgi:competence protein ComEC
MLLVSCYGKEIPPDILPPDGGQKNPDDSIRDKSPEKEKEDLIYSDLETPDGIVRIHFLDVGQGDSAFVELPDGRCMLIDGSLRGMGEKIVPYIEKLGYYFLDFVVITHPHGDHIGGLIWVFNVMPVGCVYMTTAFHSTQVYQTLMIQLFEQESTILFIGAGDTLVETEQYAIKALAPYDANDFNLNNTSIVLHLVFGQNAFMLMGDAEAESEDLILENIQANVVKVGHHGSLTSSTDRLVSKINPQYAIISCGAKNPYGHPISWVVDRWKEVGANVYRTDLHGNIVVESDGLDCTVTTQKFA